MELDIIKSQTTWNDAVGGINSNFAKIKAAFATVGTGGGGGLDEDELRLFLEQNGYTTENWVKLQKYLTAESADLFFARKEWVEQQIAGIDLSPYAKSTDVANTYATISALSTLQGQYNTLRSEFDALNNLLNDDITGVINTWNEVVDFINEYSGSQDLATILSGMNADISSRLLTSTFDSWKADTYTPLANLVANHTTKLDSIDASITNINTRLEGVDKTIEDHIAEFIAFRANFEISDNLILVRKNFASTEEVSAKGINQGTGGGGGSSYSRLDTWEGYDNNKAGYVLSAGLGYGLKVAIDELNRYDLDNRVRSIENSYVSKDAGGVVNGGLVVSSLAVAGGSSSQFLKADGSLDSRSYLPTSGGTINGVLNIYNTSERATINLVSLADVPNDLYFGSNGIKHWSLTSRDTAMGNDFLLYKDINPTDVIFRVSGSTGVVDFTYLPTYNGNSFYHTGNFNPADYLPTSGGTISNGIWAYQLNLNALNTDAGLRFSINGALKGLLRVDSNQDLWYQGASENLLLHSGNIGEYAPAITAIQGETYAAFIGEVGTAYIAYRGGSDWSVTDNGWRNEYPLIHSGNIGSQSVAYASNAGNADTLDGVHINNVVHLQDVTDADTMINGVTSYLNVDVNAYHVPFQGGELLSFGHEWYSAQLYVSHYSHRAAVRGLNYGTWMNWHELAFTDSDITGNAGSATKLNDNTAYTSWGQTFFENGKPKNVSGAFYDVSGIDFLNPVSYSYLIIGQGFAKNGMPTYLDGNNVYLRYSTATAIGLILNSSGNVTIGASDLAESNWKTFISGPLAIWDNSRRTINYTCLRQSALLQLSSYSAKDNDSLFIGQLENATAWIQAAYGGSEANPSKNHTFSIALNPLGGNVGIGTTSPSYKLDVIGDIRATESITIGGATLSWENGALKVNTSFYSEKEISAKGLSTGGGSGASYNRLDAWGDYDSSKAGYVLSASLGYGLKVAIDELNGYDLDNRVRSIENSYVSKDASGVVNGGLVVSSLAVAGGSSSQFLKADGSLDGTSYLSTSGGTISGNLTIKKESGESFLLLGTNGRVAYNPTDDTTTLYNGGSGYPALKVQAGLGHPIFRYDYKDYPLLHSGNIGEYAPAITAIQGETYAAFIGEVGTAYIAYRGGSDWSVTDNGWRNEYPLIHSGNIGSQSVAYASNAGGIQGSTSSINFALGHNRLEMINDNSGSIGDFVSAYQSGISVITEYVGWQMTSYGGDIENPYFRSLEDTGRWKPWRKLAFIDDNVARAQKLVDGSGNPIIHNSGATFYIGDTIFPTIPTHILGSEIVLRYGASATNGLILDSSGNVTVGNGYFAGGGTKLYVDGGIRFTPRTIWGQSFDGTGNVGGDLSDVTFLKIRDYDYGIYKGNYFGGLAASDIVFTAPNLYFYTSRFSMLINSSGNVTIGGSDKAGEDAKLFVDGESIFDGTIKALNTIRLYGRPNVSADTYLDNTTYAGLNIRDSSSSYMLIGSNVGIGTTSPQYKLHVAGTGYFSGALTANGGLTVNGILTVGGASIHPTANNPYFQLYQNNKYWYWQADDNYAYIGGTLSKALRIDQDGNTLIRGSLGVDALLTASNGLTVSGLSTFTGGVVAYDIHGNGQSLYLGNASNNAYIKVREDMVGSSSMWSIPRDGKATFTSLTTPTLSVTGSATIASVTIDAGNATLSNLTVNTVATLKQLIVGIDGMSCNAPATFNDFIYGSSITPKTDNYYVLGNNNYKWYGVTAYNVNVHEAITIEAGKELRFKDDDGVVHTLKYDSTKQAFVFDGNVNATGEMSAKKLNA